MSASHSRTENPAADWLLVLAAAAVPFSLLWDYSWEFTVGVESVWAPPHLATYGAVMLAFLAALALAAGDTVRARPAIRIGPVRASLGVWIVLWGAVAYAVAAVFDRWWQTGYGLAAGIWHPPQLLKATAFFAITVGAWVHTGRGQRARAGRWAFSGAGGAVLALIFVVSLPANLANRQHSAVLYEVAGGTYPVVLLAACAAGRLRWPATATALAFTILVGAAVWLLPLQPAVPLAGPIFNPRDHLLPPPFPLLLLAPAAGLDLLLRIFPSPERRSGRILEPALAFFLIFTAVQWPFAAFLLSAGADNRFFAGGGAQWPPIQSISAEMRTRFWPAPGEEFNVTHAALALGLALVAAGAGLRLGQGLKRLR